MFCHYVRFRNFLVIDYNYITVHNVVRRVPIHFLFVLFSLSGSREGNGSKAGQRPHYRSCLQHYGRPNGILRYNSTVIYNAIQYSSCNAVQQYSTQQNIRGNKRQCNRIEWNRIKRIGIQLNCIEIQWNCCIQCNTVQHTLYHYWNVRRHFPVSFISVTGHFFKTTFPLTKASEP